MRLLLLNSTSKSLKPDLSKTNSFNWGILNTAASTPSLRSSTVMFPTTSGLKNGLIFFPIKSKRRDLADQVRLKSALKRIKIISSLSCLNIKTLWLKIRISSKSEKSQSPSSIRWKPKLEKVVLGAYIRENVTKLVKKEQSRSSRESSWIRMITNCSQTRLTF